MNRFNRTAFFFSTGPLRTYIPSFFGGVNFHCLSSQIGSISPLSHTPAPLSLAFLQRFIVSPGEPCKVTQRCSLFTGLLINRVLYCRFLSAWATQHRFKSLSVIVICFPLDEPRCAWENKGEYTVATTCCALHAPSLNFAKNIRSLLKQSTNEIWLLWTWLYQHIVKVPLRWPWVTNDLAQIPGPQVQIHLTLWMSPRPVRLNNPKGKRTNSKQEQGYVTGLDWMLWCCWGQFTLIKAKVQRSDILGHSSEHVWTLRRLPHLPSTKGLCLSSSVCVLSVENDDDTMTSGFASLWCLKRSVLCTFFWLCF